MSFLDDLKTHATTLFAEVDAIRAERDELKATVSALALAKADAERQRDAALEAAVEAEADCAAAVAARRAAEQALADHMETHDPEPPEEEYPGEDLPDEPTPPPAGRVLEVGEGKEFATLQAAHDAAGDGDTIMVHPGTYTAGAVIRRNNLTIMGPTTGARTTVIFDGGVVKAKGIILAIGDNLTVRNLTLRNGRSPYEANSAGIRGEGANLTCRNVSFTNNGNGVLYTPTNPANRAEPAPWDISGTVEFRDCYFTGNGTGGGQEHGFYISRAQMLRTINCRFDRNTVGHHAKSRALDNVFTGCTFIDGQTTKPTSFHIDIPKGGGLRVENCTFTKGTPHWWEANESGSGTTFRRAGITNNENAIICYGAEMLKFGANPPLPVVVQNNKATTNVVKYTSPTRLFWNRSSPKNEDVTLSGNVLRANVDFVES